MLQFAAPAQLQAASLGLEDFYSLSMNLGFDFEDPILRSFWLPVAIATCYLALSTILAGAVLGGYTNDVAPKVPKLVRSSSHRNAPDHPERACRR